MVERFKGLGWAVEGLFIQGLGFHLCACVPVLREKDRSMSIIYTFTGRQRSCMYRREGFCGFGSTVG